MKTGVCSITFRSHSVDELVALVAKAGLNAIEWGGDVHVPPGNLSAAARAKQATLEAGLETSSYGSYYSPLDAAGLPEEFGPVLEAALVLETDTIRIWAGRLASENTPADYRRRLVEETRRIAGLAGHQGVKLAFEFHARTLTDTNESALKLIKEINHPNLYCYWQPPYWQADLNYRFQGLEQLDDRLLNLHVFQWIFDDSGGKTWGESIERRPLIDGAAEWEHYLAAVQSEGRYALLEFVKDDDPEQFLRDAAALKKIMGRAGTA